MELPSNTKTVIQFEMTPESFQAMIDKSVADIFSRIQNTDEQLSTKQATLLVGLSTHHAFRNYIKKHKITPCRITGNIKYYWKKHLLNPVAF